MSLDFVFITRLTDIEAPCGDQVLGINMSSQRVEHRHFDSYTHEQRLHLTPASHLLSRGTPVLAQCVAQSSSWNTVYTCPRLTATHCCRKNKRGAENLGNQAKGVMQKNMKLMEISCQKAGWSNGRTRARSEALWCRGNIDALCDLTCNASLNLRKWNK